jgi:acyl-homoserine-lactone acylase
VRRAGLLVAVLVGLIAAAPAQAARGGRVSIRWTEHGIPHITAKSFRGLGFGFGYAFARDNICTMADDYVTVQGRRARWFGPNGSYLQGGNGTVTNNLDSDFFWQDVKDRHVVEHLLNRRGRFKVPTTLRRLLHGYVGGYNRYLRSVGGSKGISDPTCRGKGWVRPISFRTASLRLYQLSLLAGEGVGIPGIAAAQPPTGAASAAAAGGTGIDPDALVRTLRAHPIMKAGGSNAVAVGRAGTRDRKHGLLLGNPHFPWDGPERFYQAHLRIPGTMNVAGAMLYGVPLVLIGHTRSLAWSHTVSTAFRFTPYQLQLVPGSPTSYLVDGQAHKMQQHTVAVPVRGGGGVHTVRHTLYRTRWGPIFTDLQGQSLPWTTTSAFALDDANRTNFRVFSHFLATDRAQSVARLHAILNRYEGLPWVNTIAADRGGHALYADIGTIPHVTNAEATRCNTPIGTVAYAQLGLPILDGSKSSCAWGSDPDAAAKGIFGARNLPALERSDYVTNSNDSYWLANPKHPLEGFSRIIGSERTPRSLRTRLGLIMTQNVIRHGGFTRSRMQRMVFSDRQYGGELLRDGLVALCRGLPGGRAPLSSGGTIAVGRACDILAKWDLHENLRSSGAVLFSRFFDHASTDGLFSRPFAVSDPVHTPSGLDPSQANAAALGDAVQDLRGAHIPLGAAPARVQRRAGIPIHGGVADPNGEFNAIYAPFDPGQGFEPVGDGSSYVQTVTWNNSPCPDAATILTYSESANPRSPHHADQTRMFSHKRWLTDHFCTGDVRRHTERTAVLRSR